MKKKKGGGHHAPITTEKEIKRMNLNVEAELHRAFKIAVASEGKEMTEVLLEFITKYVAEHPAAARLADKGGRQ